VPDAVRGRCLWVGQLMSVEMRGRDIKTWVVVRKGERRRSSAASHLDITPSKKR